MTERKRILCISRAYGKHAGGMERLSFELISSLEEDGSFDVQKIVHETKPGASLLSTRLRSSIFVLTILPKALVVSRHADIVHMGDPVLSIVGWVIMRMRKIPVAVTVHGLDVAYTNPIYRIYIWLFFRSFSAYIPISQYARAILEKHAVSGTVQIIPPGIRDHIYDATKTRDNLGKLLHKNISRAVVLATTGRLVARKGHAWFIEQVIPRLPKNVLYAVAGNGPELTTLTSLVASLKLEQRVFLLGRISDEKQQVLLNTIDAFIQPNILQKNDAEGFGIAPLEAALCGRMVFASKVDGIPSAIHDGKNGILLPAKETTKWVNTLNEYIKAPKSMEPNGEAARAYTLEHFNWKTIAKQYAALFQDIVKK